MWRRAVCCLWGTCYLPQRRWICYVVSLRVFTCSSLGECLREIFIKYILVFHRDLFRTRVSFGCLTAVLVVSQQFWLSHSSFGCLTAVLVVSQQFWLSHSSFVNFTRRSYVSSRDRFLPVGKYLSTHGILGTTTVDKSDTYSPSRFRDNYV